MNKQELIHKLVESADPDTFDLELLQGMSEQELKQLWQELYLEDPDLRLKHNLGETAR